MDWKLELLPIPVTDVDRAKAFYVDRAGFVADHDPHRQRRGPLRAADAAGSACSFALGLGISDAPPGSARAQLVVSDIDAAHDELAGRGVEVSDVQEFPWGKFLFFADPDGNRWSVQLINTAA